MLKLKYNFLALAVFMTAGLILSKNAHAECKEGEERMTESRYVFTCDTSHPKLGEAWRDPRGLIWGDVAKNEDGSIQKMGQSSEYLKETGRKWDEIGAKEYCESIGARLPSKEEFEQLTNYMGMTSSHGYRAQILPNFPNDRTGYHQFWSLTIRTHDRSEPDHAYYFDSLWGKVISFYRDDSHAVRCVMESSR